MNPSTFTRRQFLEFLGATGALSAVGLSSWTLLSGCATNKAETPSSLLSNQKSNSKNSFIEKYKHCFINPSNEDRLTLPKGIQAKILVKWQDTISAKGLRFGNNNDYCAFVAKGSSSTDGVLMVNHEFVHPLFVSGFDSKHGMPKTKAQVELEQESVGISLLRLHQVNGSWNVDLNSPLNRRISGKTRIPFAGNLKVDGSRTAKGTFANCAGGITPWKTFLTCEENYDHYYGEWENPINQQEPWKKRKKIRSSKDLYWSNFEPLSPSHYGWVVEINPWTGAAKKHVALGRFSHECATTTKAKSGRTVVYMGDDAVNECMYKFISDHENSLASGTLYVAHLASGRWLPLTMEAHPDFKNRFENQTDLLVRTREAAHLMKGTPLDRPEDIEINPANGDVIVALTNNHAEQRPHGSLLRIREKDSDAGALEFSSDTWISGGPDAGLSCPDNLAFDHSGNLWCTSDMSDEKMNKPPYLERGNNGLYFIPMHGPNAGQVFQVASAPTDAELSGPMFTPDGETLLLSVQHPGEQTTDISRPTSTWPGGAGQLPKSSVVSLTGEGLKALVNYRG